MVKKYEDSCNRHLNDFILVQQCSFLSYSALMVWRYLKVKVVISELREFKGLK